MQTDIYDVALSFAGEDRLYVQKVAHLLRSKNVKVFYDDFEKVSLWGKNLIDHLEMVYANQSRFIVIFISKYYAEKDWTNHERKAAQEREFSKPDCILPARFDDTKVPGVFSTTAFIDLRKTTEEQFAELIYAKINEQENSNQFSDEDTDEESENSFDEVSDNEPEVLHNEQIVLKGQDYELYNFVLEEGDELFIQIVSSESLNIVILNSKDAEAWQNDKEVFTYDFYRNRKRIEFSFEVEEDGEYSLVLFNNAFITSAEIDVEISFSE